MVLIIQGRTANVVSRFVKLQEVGCGKWGVERRKMGRPESGQAAHFASKEIRFMYTIYKQIYFDFLLTQKGA